MEADDILKGRSLVNRQIYQQKIADTAEARSEQQQPTTYIGFDAEQGLARLQDSSGSISYGSAQTNGAVGIGDNIRLRRGGVLAVYDAMPSRKTNSTMPTKKAISIVFGVLVTVEYNYNYPPKDEEIDSLNPLDYFTLSTDFCIGILMNGKLKIQYLFKPTPPAWSRYPDYITSTNSFYSFLQTSYYSMFYTDNILNYIGSAQPSLPADSLGRYNYAFMAIKLFRAVINKNNPQNSIIKEKEIHLSSTTPFELVPRSPNNPNPVNESLELYGAPPVSICLKYKSSNSQVKFAFISGLASGESFDSAQQVGVIIWDLGNASEIIDIESINNPACNFGFTWTLKIPNPTGGYIGLGVGIRIKGGYGCEGGIVLIASNNTSDLPTYSPYYQEFSVFIPEEFLQGRDNKNLVVTDINFDTSLVFVSPPNFDNFVTTPGTMPGPLETKELFYPYTKTLPTSEVVLRSKSQPHLIKRLMTFTNFNKDKGKEIFS
ncbi:hypothetical protein [Nostoc sp.]|uniref:hypothetical protein n=1 Tax=Nostoc sp. TaxID=1180 RepID=UPI002FF27097